MLGNTDDFLLEGANQRTELTFVQVFEDKVAAESLTNEILFFFRFRVVWGHVVVNNILRLGGGVHQSVFG